MRIAVCISGQPRTWRRVVNTWKTLFSPEDEVYYFFHSWDYNSITTTYGKTSYSHNSLISEQEKSDMVNIIQPSRYVFESKKDFPFDKNIIGWWCGSQFYSMMSAMQLKRDWELASGKDFDICVRIRFDLYIDNKFPITQCPNNTIRAIHYGIDDTVSYPNLTGNGLYVLRRLRLGDMFFYAPSVEFDIICNFYKSMPFYISKYIMQGKDYSDVPPEFAFVSHVKRHNMTIERIDNPNMILLLQRDEWYKGELGEHEKI